MIIDAFKYFKITQKQYNFVYNHTPFFTNFSHYPWTEKYYSSFVFQVTNLDDFTYIYLPTDEYLMDIRVYCTLLRPHHRLRPSLMHIIINGESINLNSLSITTIDTNLGGINYCKKRLNKDYNYYNTVNLR